MVQTSDDRAHSPERERESERVSGGKLKPSRAGKGTFSSFLFRELFVTSRSIRRWWGLRRPPCEGMSAIDALEILGQIQVLVIDKLQVVSYKWLSRNFSVTSKRAKRLLKEYVDKHGDKVEVVYSLSGWLKNNAPTYCIKLASRQNLEGAVKEFDGSYSVEVYSIQSCIPKDLAVLWNAEFVQAEQLFDQPSTAENCLRSNRFGGISNPFVNRAVNGKLATFTSKSQLKESVGIALQTKDYIIPKDELFQPQQGKEGNLGVKEELKSANTVGSVERTAQNVGDDTKKSIPLKESANSLKTSRKVVPNEKNSSASGGSLATLWGRASVKSKPSNAVLDSTSNMPNASYTADAQIFAQEAADAGSSDDEEGYGLRCKRESNVSGTRKRQFIINYSDEDEEEENIVRLASPKPKIAKSPPDSLQNTKNMSMNKEIFNSEELKADTLMVKEDNIEEKNDRLSSRNDSIAEASLLKTENNVQNELSNTNGKENSSNTSKRKKVVKIRIDERGREVMEVVWEESACTKDAEKDATTYDTGNRPTMANKAQATGSNALGNTGTKGGTKKPGKAGGKDVKQGNILSFFRKA